MTIKNQCTSKLTGNSLSISGTNVKEFVDILTDAFLLIPKRSNIGFVSRSVYFQAEVIYNRHKEDLFMLGSLHISGHSLGGGIAQLICLMLKRDGYTGNVILTLNGSIKVLGYKARKNLGTVIWNERYKDIVPKLGWWLKPKKKIYLSGEKRKNIFDYDFKEHMAYW